MAYQNVGTPRFYVCSLQWAKSLGLLQVEQPFDTSHRNYQDPLDAVGINPTELFQVQATDPYPNWHYNISSGEVPLLHADVGWVGLLGHSLGLEGNKFQILDQSGEGSFSAFPLESINWSPDDGIYSKCDYDGFTLWTFSLNSVVFYLSTQIYYYGNFDPYCNSICFGTYFDMPVSPNLSLSLSYEYDGVRKITTKGGADLSYNRYTKPAMWGDLSPWELDVGVSQTRHLGKSGRRSWDLKFSFMDDGDLWGPNQSLAEGAWTSITADQGWDSGDFSDQYNSFSKMLLNDNNFFSQVWHKTNSGVLPFVFQPDNTNNKPDQFCIARFKNNSLKATQSAFNVYDISLTIEEAW